MMNSFSDTEIHQFRQETDGTQNIIHFNNAGAALPPNAVRDRVLDYLKEEALIGGYEAMAKYEKELQKCYQHVADFINCEASEIALVENATVAWNLAFSSIDFQPGDIILTTAVEYGSNFINYLKVKKEKGVEIKFFPTLEPGEIDLVALEQMITPKVKLISVTHIPTNGGLVNPAETIGEIAEKYGILYLLDSCQSVGQLPMDVKKLKCSILTATGRKFLRGPRGTGFLFVDQKKIAQLNPPYLDQHAASWTALDQFQIHPNAQRFENWENNKAMRLGLSTAIQYANKIGMDKIWPRIQYLGNYMREALQDIPQIEVLDLGKIKGGIVTFRHQKMASVEVQNILLEKKINTSLAVAQATLIDMRQRNIENLNRASVHYYNTEEEIDTLVKVLSSLPV